MISYYIKAKGNYLQQETFKMPFSLIEIVAEEWKVVLMHAKKPIKTIDLTYMSWIYGEFKKTVASNIGWKISLFHESNEKFTKI